MSRINLGSPQASRGHGTCGYSPHSSDAKVYSKEQIPFCRMCVPKTVHSLEVQFVILISLPAESVTQKTPDYPKSDIIKIYKQYQR